MVWATKMHKGHKTIKRHETFFIRESVLTDRPSLTDNHRLQSEEQKLYCWYVGYSQDKNH